MSVLVFTTHWYYTLVFSYTLVFMLTPFPCSDHTRRSPSRAHVTPRAGWLSDPARPRERSSSLLQPSRGPSEPPWGVTTTPCTPERGRGFATRGGVERVGSKGAVRVLHPVLPPPMGARVA